MCLVLIGWRAHPDYRLIVAANRDEFHARRTEPLRRWPERPTLLAGRDLDSGTSAPGVWAGLSNAPGDRRFAAVTNVRGPGESRAGARSRGVLAREFLCAQRADPQDFIRGAITARDIYNGYNLIVSDLRQLWWCSNRGTVPARALEPGFHGLANDAHLRSGDGSRHPPSPKVERGLDALRRTVESGPDDLDGYFSLLADRTPAPDDQLPDTGMSPGIERLASARFLANPLYGTRSSTVLLVREDGSFAMVERSFDRLGDPTGEARLADAALDRTGGDR
ncbi:NRDE family protein [Nocardia mexicana]|uniref:Uncharacterized protein with NRDE domain n=1 Tax=Nocardia mexicana TaxID=279262 RepID=A0A370GK75_9NOCA|nr:NRDE family protein [Nocardia mexicana]RDI42794.1 uncharacterized protein with NRDE domain [Nocardia mexicana]